MGVFRFRLELDSREIFGISTFHKQAWLFVSDDVAAQTKLWFSVSHALDKVWYFAFPRSSHVEFTRLPGTVSMTIYREKKKKKKRGEKKGLSN